MFKKTILACAMALALMTAATACGDKKSSTDKALDEYEEYVNKYISVVEKVNNGDASAFTEMADLLQQAQSLSSKLDGEKAEMTDEQVKRLIEIQQKMLQAAAMQ